MTICFRGYGLLIKSKAGDKLPTATRLKPAVFEDSDEDEAENKVGWYEFYALAVRLLLGLKYLKWNGLRRNY